MKLIMGLFLSALLFTISSEALSLKHVANSEIAHGKVLNETVLGGFSGAVYNEGELYLLSDDTGRVNEPRFYKFEFKQNKNRIDLVPKSLSFIDPKKKKFSKKDFLDLEGMALDSEGHLIISSEGRANSIPRQGPRIFKVNSVGEVLSDFVVPAKYNPESAGEQAQGVQNNMGFEGLSISSDKKTLYSMTESSLFQDNIDLGTRARMLKWNLKESKTPIAEFLYPIDDFTQNEEGVEVYRGVGSILEISEDRLLVLERGVRLSKTFSRTYTVALYEVDFSKATSVLDTPKMVEKKVVLPTKKKIFDFETDKWGDSKQEVQNFEALTWGPQLANGKSSLIVVSDNNFKKSEKTQILLFEVDK